MGLASLRSLFPVTQANTYLNHASVAALPQPVVEAMASYLAKRGQLGGLALADWDDRVEVVRSLMARFVGGHRDEITFTGSVSHGLNIVAAGLDWQPGDNVICAETEFPANVYPWANLRRRGVELRLVPARANRILVDDVATAIDGSTRLVALSFVEFGTGYRNDLAAIADLCCKRGVYLCVDGIQGLGALQFSLAEIPVDALATHAAKWMLGPIGAGFVSIRQGLLAHLTPVMAGWRSVVHRDDYFRYDSPLRTGGERFEPGSLNAVGLVGMGAAVELLLKVGLDRIEARISVLTDRLIDGLRRRGSTITTPVARREERSGIICFRHPGIAPSALSERLAAEGVVISLRGDVIRVSPHFYNTEDEIDRLLSLLPAKT